MNNVIYQQDGAPPHCPNVSLDFLNKYVPGDRLISRRTNYEQPMACLLRGGFRGGDGGDASPHQPKSNDFDRKISLYFEKLGSISGCIPPTSVKLTVSAEKSLSISVKTFFFFFF